MAQAHTDHQGFQVKIDNKIIDQDHQISLEVEDMVVDTKAEEMVEVKVKVEDKVEALDKVEDTLEEEDNMAKTDVKADRMITTM